MKLSEYKGPYPVLIVSEANILYLLNEKGQVLSSYYPDGTLKNWLQDIPSMIVDSLMWPYCTVLDWFEEDVLTDSSISYSNWNFNNFATECTCETLIFGHHPGCPYKKENT